MFKRSIRGANVYLTAWVSISLIRETVSQDEVIIPQLTTLIISAVSCTHSSRLCHKDQSSSKEFWSDTSTLTTYKAFENLASTNNSTVGTDTASSHASSHAVRFCRELAVLHSAYPGRLVRTTGVFHCYILLL